MQRQKEDAKTKQIYKETKEDAKTKKYAKRQERIANDIKKTIKKRCKET